MFGLPTFPKFILIAAIIAVVWYFWRRGQQRSAGGSRGGNGRAAQNKRQNAPNQKPIEDMVQCKACGAYVPAKSGCSCGRGTR
ncbi:MAG: hypothetical protein IPK59_07510 [Rhodospirillaceae bacterium]|nr:hypothetical protein [Rhodospirillaceae bacterium]